jgi:DNA-directed RNA polymerase subunit H (RpoH/RPB5)
MKFRNIEQKSQQLSYEEFGKEFSTNGYVKILGDTITILLVHPDKKYSKFESNTKLLIQKYIGKPELLVVTNISHNSDNQLSRIKSILSNIETDTKIMFRSYVTFLYNIPEHKLSSKHTVVNNNAIKADFSRVYLSIKELPIIYEHDPQITWIGAKEGDIIEIERFSPTAGKTIVYRRVIKKEK